MSKKSRRNTTSKPISTPVAKQIAPATSPIPIELWMLPAPDREYLADVCRVEVVSGIPTIFFGQVGPNGKLVSIIAVAMGVQAFKTVREAFSPVLKDIEARFPDLEVVESNTFEAREIAPEHFFKFSSTIVRGGFDDDFALLDFYTVGLVAPQIRRSNQPLDIRPCVRVRMSHVIFRNLFQLITEMRKG